MKFKNNKWFSIIELIIAITISTIFSVTIFNWIQDIILNSNINKTQRDTYWEITQWITKIQKIIYENWIGINVKSPDTTITDWEIFNFIKESPEWIEKIYFLELNNNCITWLWDFWYMLQITDWLNDEIKLTKCIVKNNNALSVKPYFIDSELKENIINLEFSIENKYTNINDIIKSTVFVK